MQSYRDTLVLALLVSFSKGHNRSASIRIHKRHPRTSDSQGLNPPALAPPYNWPRYSIARGVSPTARHAMAGRLVKGSWIAGMMHPPQTESDVKIASGGAVILYLVGFLTCFVSSVPLAYIPCHAMPCHPITDHYK